MDPSLMFVRGGVGDIVGKVQVIQTDKTKHANNQSKLDKEWNFKDRDFTIMIYTKHIYDILAQFILYQNESQKYCLYGTKQIIDTRGVNPRFVTPKSS